MQDGRLRIETRVIDGDVVELALHGELDLATAPALRTELDEIAASRRPVRLDLAEVEFMDSSGLAVILAAIRDAERDGRSIGIARELTRPVARLLELTSVAQIIPWADVPA